jgi:phosphatidate cytidylyltransferase
VADEIDPLDRRMFDESDLDAPPSMPTEAVPLHSDEPVLRFGDETGPLPHWTEPPTGQVAAAGNESDLSAWSGFGSSGPNWREDSGSFDAAELSSLGEGTRLGAMAPVDDDEDLLVTPIEPDRRDRERDPSSPVATIRTTKKLSSVGAPPRRGEPVRERRPAGGATTAAVKGGRNMPVAIAVGVGLLVVFGGLAKFVGPKGLVALVAAILGVAAAEFYDSARKAGYHPAQLLGILASAALPLAAYWRGEAALPHVLAVAMAAALITFIFSGGIESNPLPNTAITIAGIVYIGLMGSFAGLILQFPNGVGTLLACVAGVVAYDVAGLVFGSSIGRSPLVPWISPNKTWEGLILGMIASFLAVLACNIFGLTPWNAKMIQCVQLGIVVAIAAPLGDLAESMLKRSLGTKDFGEILPGHGGVLDRFDCFLFVLPAAYYLSRVLNVY